MSLLKDLNLEVRQLLDADMKEFPFGTKRIINDINIIAPHISWLFEDGD